MILLSLPLVAQESEQKDDTPVYRTFKSTYLINSRTIETLPARKMEFQIGHRFGDINGGWETLYGIENAADILIGIDYGITDRLMAGLYRTKGGGPLRALMHGTMKYKILAQTEGQEKNMPLTLSVAGIATMSSQKKSGIPNTLTEFDKFAHRMSYGLQIIAARKFGDRFALQIAPSWVHRNLVPFGDQNDLFSISYGARIQMTRTLGLILDGTIPFDDYRSANNGFYPAMGIGLEIDTGGHVFQVNFTNATGITETDFIPYTQKNWLDGEFRFGFKISRWFNL